MNQLRNSQYASLFTHHVLRFTPYVSRFAPHALLVILPLILLAPIVFGGRVLFWGVPLMQFYPWQRFAVEMWRLGEVPLWNPLLGNGAPLAANLQTGAFYPLNFLHLILPTEQAMGYTAALHVALAGLFMFAFLRSIGLRPLPALIGAIAFQLNGFLIARLGFLSITVTLPWVVAWLWRSERLLRSRHRRDGLWLVVVVGMGLLAGHAQTALYGLILLAGYVIFRTGQITTETRRTRRIFSVLSVSPWLYLVLGFCLAAIQLLPAAELARESQRAGGLDDTFAMSHSYWPWRLLTLFAPDLFGNPVYGTWRGYDNYWENAAYVGVLPLGLAGLAIREWWRQKRGSKGQGEKERRGEGEQGSADLRHPATNPAPLAHTRPSTGRPAPGGPPRRSRGYGLGRLARSGGKCLQLLTSNFQSPTLFFAAMALVSLVLALGWFTPIYPFLFRVVPGFSLFQGPARWLSVFVIALSALAAIGAESLLRGRGDLRRSGRWIVAGVALTGAGFAARFFLAGSAATFADPTARLGLLVAAGGLLLGLRPPADDRRFTGWAAALAVVVAVDLLNAHAALNPTIDPAVYHLPASSAATIRAGGDGRVFMFDKDEAALREAFGVALPFADFGAAEVDRWLAFRESLLPNTSMIDGIPSAGNFDSLLIGRYVQLRDAINTQPWESALRLLNVMNVRTIASPRELPLPIVTRTSSVILYRNDAALPRAWIVPSARVVTDSLAAILDPTFDPLSEVVLEGAIPPDASRAPALATEHSAGARVAPHASRFTLYSLRDTPNAVTIRAASAEEGYLVLADTWYAGWRASIDGQPVDVLRANLAFRAVTFPAGEHTVEFRYEPDSFRWGAAVSAGSALLVVAGLALSARRR